MSLVYITKHNENIYNLNKFDRFAEERRLAFKIRHNSQRYVSKYHDQVIKKIFDVINVDPHNKLIASRPGIGFHKTMGYAKQPLKTTCDFLRKNEGIKWKRKKEHTCHKSTDPIPPIPKCYEVPMKICKVEKNIIKINIDKIKNYVVRRPKPKLSTTCRGDLCDSGIMPAYIFSPTFGKLPNYLLKYNKILCEEQKFCRENQNHHHPCDDEFYMLDPVERSKLIEGLKNNWIEKQLIFQRLPAVVGSGIKYRRKLEVDLHQLEDDIVLLEYNPKIYICNC